MSAPPVNGSAGLVFWYKADSGVYKDAGSTPASDGDQVQQWNDLSGNLRHLTQSNLDKRPIFRTNRLNGRPSLTFDGVNDLLQAAAFTFNQPIDIYIVYRPINWTANAVIWAGNSAAGVYYAQKTGLPKTRVYAGSAGSDYSGPTIGQWTVLELGIDNTGGFTRSGTGSLKSVIMDGLVGTNANATGAIGANNPGGFTVGADADGTNPANFEIVEIIGYSSALSSGNSDTVRLTLGQSTPFFLRGTDEETVIDDIVSFGSDEETVIDDVVFFGSDEETVIDDEVIGPPPPPPIPPALLPIDTVTATCVAWGWEDRLFLSYGGRTYSLDLAVQGAGWVDCGYGYVNSRIVVSRFNHPYMCFLASNLEPAGYGDRTEFVSLTHRSMTFRDAQTKVVPVKTLRIRPWGQRGSNARGVKLKVWGTIQKQGNERRIGTVVCTTENGYYETAGIYFGAYSHGLVLEHSFSPSMVGEQLFVDLDFDTNVLEVEVSFCQMEIVQES